MKTPEQIAADVVGKFSWSSNVVEGGCMVGQQHAVARAIATAVAQERVRSETARRALVDGAIALNGVTSGRLKPGGRVARTAQVTVMEALDEITRT